MIDRDARNDLAVLIRRYLDEKLTAFEFDEALDEFRDSGDDGVRFVADAVWYHYDDCDDHLVVLSKSEWNYFQRLLLLLESKSVVSFTQTKRWSYSQLIAFVLLCLCGYTAVQTGFGEHLQIFFLPLGIGSIMLAHFRRPAEEPAPYSAITAPFKSIRDLRIAYENSAFRKVRYPKELIDRHIRSPIMNWFLVGQHYTVWTMFAPIPLLVQCFPVETTDLNIDPA